MSSQNLWGQKSGLDARLSWGSARKKETAVGTPRNQTSYENASAKENTPQAKENSKYSWESTRNETTSTIPPASTQTQTPPAKSNYGWGAVSTPQQSFGTAKEPTSLFPTNPSPDSKYGWGAASNPQQSFSSVKEPTSLFPANPPPESKYGWGAASTPQQSFSSVKEPTATSLPRNGYNPPVSKCSFDFTMKPTTPSFAPNPSGDGVGQHSTPNAIPAWGQSVTNYCETPSRTEEFPDKISSPVNTEALQSMISKQLIVDDDEFVSYPDGQGGDNLRSSVLWHEFNISRELTRGLAAMNFRQPSGIQARALPVIISGKHTLVQSQNGTGKTATYLISILSTIDYSLPHCQALVMVHTHELALQVADVARTMGTHISGFRVAVAIPGTEDNSLPGPVNAQLVVGTPGTLWRWAAVKTAEKIDPIKLKIFVMDEADQLMETEAFNDTLRLLKKKLSPECQLLFFSATFEENVRTHARNLVGANNELKEILLSVHELALQNVRQFKMECRSFEEKLLALFSIYRIEMISGCLVFCKTRDEAHKLADRMRQRDHLVGVLTGKMTPQERENEIERFRKSETRALISTNVCSRGLDIDHINLVVNWDLPILPRDPANPTLRPDFDTYLHRVGRSGRFGRHGLAINFISNEIDNRILDEIQKYFGIHIPGVDYSNVDDLERIKDPRHQTEKF